MRLREKQAEGKAEQNRGTGREREKSWKEGLKKDFQQKGFSGFSRCESESIFN